MKSGLIQYFNKEAGQWDSKYKRSYFFKGRYDQIKLYLSRYRNYFPISLDYGCGSGILTELLAKHSDAVIGTDASEKMLAICKEKFKDKDKIQIQSIEESVTKKYDFILCSSVIEYIENDMELINDLVSYLNNNGILFITFPNRFGIVQLLNRHILQKIRMSKYVDYQKHVYTLSAIKKEVSLIKNIRVLDAKHFIGIPIIKYYGFSELMLLVLQNKNLHLRNGR